MTSSSRLYGLALFGLLAFFMLNGTAFGEETDTSLARSLQNRFETHVKLWCGPLSVWPTWLLLSLAGLSWTWSAIQFVLKNADIKDFVVVRQITVFQAHSWPQISFEKHALVFYEPHVCNF